MPSNQPAELKQPTEPPAQHKAVQIALGTLVLVAIAVAGWVISTSWDLATPVVITLAIAIVVGNVVRLPRQVDVASTFALKRVLKFAIICLGAGVSLTALQDIGGMAILAIVAGIAAAIVVAIVAGRLVKLDSDSTLLVAVGTAICGASAIAAVAPVLKAKRDDIATALGCIFALNALALVLYPLLGAWLDMDSLEFGTWAGIAVHDTASAVAAGFAFGEDSGQTATVVKLARTLFLIPLLVFLSLAVHARDKTSTGNTSVVKQITSSFPLFVIGFVLLAAAASLGLLMGAEEYVSEVGKYLILLVIAAVGLGLKLQRLVSVGPRVAAVGAIASIAVGVVSLVIILAL